MRICLKQYKTQKSYLILFCCLLRCWTWSFQILHIIIGCCNNKLECLDHMFVFLLATLCVLVLFCALSFHLIDSVNDIQRKFGKIIISKYLKRCYETINFFISLMHVLSYLKFNLDPLKETRHSYWTSS